MDLKCSILGHSFEPAGVERDREKRGSEVVTIVRELEQCQRCGQERVVSENTEVTTVLDSTDVDIDDDALEGAVDETLSDPDREPDTDSGDSHDIDEPASGVDSDEIPPDPPEDEPASGTAAAEAAAAVDELADDPPTDEHPPRDPAEEDTEILTEEDPGREQGEWPDGTPQRNTDSPSDSSEPREHNADDAADSSEQDDDSLSGITIPEGSIVCPDCDFQVDAESSYRDGDPCPECGTWLTIEPDA